MSDIRKHSVNRPPTPDEEDVSEDFEKDELTLGEIINIKKKWRKDVTVDELIRVITPKGRASVPDSVKEELLNRIQNFIVSACSFIVFVCYGDDDFVSRGGGGFLLVANTKPHGEAVDFTNVSSLLL